MVPWWWAGTDEELCESLEILSTHGNRCGPELRRDKCELWSTTHINAVDSRIKRSSQSGIEFLGAAIGTHTFVASCLEKQVIKLENVLDNLGYLEDPQWAPGILRSRMGAPKLVYSFWCNTPSSESKNRSWGSTFFEPNQSCLCWFHISVSKHSRTNYWFEPNSRK